MITDIVPRVMRIHRGLLAVLVPAALGLLGCDSAPARSHAATTTQSAVWIDPARLVPGPVRHHPLPAAQLERIRALQQIFADVDPSPFEKWVGDFERDVDPEREIAIFEDMAAAYTAYCRDRPLSIGAKGDVYQIVLLRSGAPEAEVLPRLKLKVLSMDDAREVLRGYRAPPTPVRAMQK